MLPLNKPEKREPKPKKPIRKIGKVTSEWLKTRREWIKAHPPDYRGTYQCAICLMPVSAKAMHLDHIKKRGANPSDRNNHDNLRPTHEACNYAREM